MEKRLFHPLERGSGLMLVIFMLLFASCAIGYDDSETYSSDVRDAQLESPDLSKMEVITRTTVTGSEILEFRWPVVHGAGGYEFTLYNVDDPDNPIIVDKIGSEIINGCTALRTKAEDTKYEIVVLTLGNEKYNNKTATAPSRTTYSTLVPTFATIPSGTDLGVFFTENPIQPLEEGIEEIAYDLEPGGIYTMSADVALNLTTLTIRGDKIDHAKLKVTGNSSFISDGAGFKLKWLDIDMADYTGKGFISYNATVNPDAKADNNFYATQTSNQLVSCNITNLKKPILCDNGKKYALYEFQFRDCVIEQNLGSSEYFIDFSTGIVKDLRIMNTTIYNKTRTSNNWIRYGNVQIDKADHRPFPSWNKAGFDIRNSTFWQVAHTKQMFNSNGFNRTANYVTIQSTIFVDCGNKEVTRRFLMGSANPERTFNMNTYWYLGETPAGEVNPSSSYSDKTGTHIDADPKLKDPANGDFTVTGAEQISKMTGDPRWLPIPVITE